MIGQLAVAALLGRPLRTALTAVGIAVAVASTVIFLSLGEGIRQVWGQQLGSIGPDLQVSYGPFDAASISAVPELPLAYRDRLAAVADEVGITSVTPLLFHLRAGLDLSRSFVFQGLPPDTDVTGLYYGFEVIEGRPLGPGDEGREVAVVGATAAARSGLAIGDELRFNPGSAFSIVGLTRATGGLLDNGVLVPLTALQRAIGIPDRISYLALDLDDPGRASDVAERLGARFPDLGFQTRGDVLGVIEEGIRVADVIRLGISAIALIVGAVAVANTMLMSVSERTREFGVVRAVGARPRFLFGLVLVEAVLLSLIGAAIGVGLGRLGVVVVNGYARGLIGLDVAALTPRLVGFAVAVAIVVGLVSGLPPAARAARLPVARALARE